MPAVLNWVGTAATLIPQAVYAVSQGGSPATLYDRTGSVAQGSSFKTDPGGNASVWLPAGSYVFTAQGSQLTDPLAVFTVTLPESPSGRLLQPYDYSVTGGGTSLYTAYDRAGAVVTANADLGPILKTLFATIVTAGVGGTILLGPGRFNCNPVWTADPNAASISSVIQIPWCNGLFIPIRLLGSGVGGMTQTYTGNAGVSTAATVQTGTQIYFNNTGNGPNAYNSFIRANQAPAGNPSGPFSQMSLYVDGIRFTQASNQTNVAMLDCYNAGNLSIGTVAFDTQLANSSQVASPAASNQAIAFPQVNGYGPYTVEWLSVAGYNLGVEFSEHLTAKAIYAQACQAPLHLYTGSHGSHIQRLMVQECPYWVDNSAAGGILSIGVIDPEPLQSLGAPNAWQNFTAAFSNSTNAVYGDFRVAPWSSLRAFGALPSGVRFGFQGQPVAQSVPTIGASPYTLQIQYDAMILVTAAGTVTGVTIDGQAVFGNALTAGQVIVLPANHPLVITYTVAPTFRILPF